MEVQPKTGDVFLMPLNGRNWALGQLVSAWHDELYVAIFDGMTETQEVDPRGVLTQKPVLLALTLDAKLGNGDWPIVGNVKENLDGLPQPAFKVRQSGSTFVESRDRTVTRRATSQEENILRYRSVSSPAVVEEAAQAYFGVSEWKDAFDKFLYDYYLCSSRIL